MTVTAAIDLGPTDATSLSALQLERMQATLAHAYENVPLYRKRFDSEGIKPCDLTTLADLARFPFTTKSDLRENYPFGMFAVPPDAVARLHASSGTTGQPTLVGYTRGDLDIWANCVARSMHAAGVRPGMKVHIAYGYGLFTGGLGAHYGAEALGCTVIPMSGGQSEKQVRLIQDLRPEVIMVTPSYMLALLDEFRRQGIDPRTTSLRLGIFGAEPWTEAMRREIEQAFAIDATDIYGLSEVMGPGVAQEFVDAKGATTIWEDHFYPEIVDPATGAVLPAGEEGELVFTSLTKDAMPVIRYRTRDLTRLLPGTRTPMRQMARITGRCDDMLIIRGVNLFPSQLEELLLECRILSPHFQLEITRPERLDQVRLDVEPRTGMDIAAANAEAALLANRIKEVVGISVAVQTLPAGSIARSGGKAVRVHDRRGAGAPGALK